MRLLNQNPSPVFLIILCFVITRSYTWAQTFGQAELVNEWKLLEFDWPSQEDKEESINLGTYRPERNLLAGIKVNFHLLRSCSVINIRLVIFIIILSVAGFSFCSQYTRLNAE